MIKVLLLLNALITLAIALFLIVKFTKINKDSPSRRAYFLLFLMGTIFILPCLLFLLWFLGIISYNSSDLLFIHSIIIFFEAILLLLIVHYFRRSKKVFYLLFIYLIFIFSMVIGLNFSDMLLISSLLLILILFILLISFPDFAKSSRFAIFYSSISLFLQIILLFQDQFSPIITLISNIFFLIFLFFFLLDINNISTRFFERKILRLKHSHYLFDFLRYFVFIIILTNFIFIGVLATHEGGHFLISKLTPNCGLERIVYEGGLPRTEILCDNSVSSTNKILFGGIFIPIIVALLFFFGGGTFMKEISLLIIGFDILISYKDFIDLGFSQNVSTFFSIFGGVIILLAIGILAKSRTTEEEFIHLEES